MVLQVEQTQTRKRADAMKAAVFHGVNDLRLESVAIPVAGPGEAVVRVTMTTI